MLTRYILSIFLLLASPAAAQTALECQGRQKELAVAELMFGRNIGARTGVTQSQWDRFLEREISPRFPEGLTVVDAVGRWRDPARNRIVREPSKIVTLMLRDDSKDMQRLDEIVETYKRRFKQQSVGVIIRPACVSF
jgi:hypothetical protein